MNPISLQPGELVLIMGGGPYTEEPDAPTYIDEITVGCCWRCNAVYVHDSDDSDIVCGACVRAIRKAARAEARKKRKAGSE